MFVTVLHEMYRFQFFFRRQLIFKKTTLHVILYKLKLTRLDYKDFSSTKLLYLFENNGQTNKNYRQLHWKNDSEQTHVTKSTVTTISLEPVTEKF